MKRPLLAALTLTLLLGACSTRLNPMNWWGDSEETTLEPLVDERGIPVKVEERPLADQISFLQIEQIPGGAVVRARALPPTQGYYRADLVARPVENGVLVFDFRLVPPPAPTRSSTPQSREVEAAAFLSRFDLEGVTTITVQGAQNARSSRR